ncbi:hypothetical protein RHIZ404_90027 [Rhizobium sp. EC-SD404]|nr:hypothetical protein RHIZ404_90027 [Rhizobium sp. EC-SD404]
MPAVIAEREPSAVKSGFVVSHQYFFYYPNQIFRMSS